MTSVRGSKACAMRPSMGPFVLSPGFDSDDALGSV
jgi:hypothetical protein